MMRKIIHVFQYECYKSIITILKNYKKNSSMLFRDNVHAQGSKSLTQVHTKVHCCHGLPKELSNLSEARKSLILMHNHSSVQLYILIGTVSQVSIVVHRPFVFLLQS